MKLKAVLSAVMCSALSLSALCGCNVVGSDADSLLRPPKFMGDEAEIEELISKTASIFPFIKKEQTRTRVAIKLKFPPLDRVDI